MNGDSLCFTNLRTSLTVLSDKDVAGILVGCTVPDASRYGTLLIGGRGELLGFKEKQPGAGIINAGTYLFRDSVVKQFFARTPLSFEDGCVSSLLQKGFQLKVSLTNGPFLDIGTPESLAEAERFIEQNRKQFAA
jgi:D-glycero-alpha-D-manno-heptose 1-phosphate guanylyltransferase